MRYCQPSAAGASGGLPAVKRVHVLLLVVVLLVGSKVGYGVVVLLVVVVVAAGSHASGAVQHGPAFHDNGHPSTLTLPVPL